MITFLEIASGITLMTAMFTCLIGSSLFALLVLPFAKLNSSIKNISAFSELDEPLNHPAVA